MLQAAARWHERAREGQAGSPSIRKHTRDVSPTAAGRCLTAVCVLLSGTLEVVVDPPPSTSPAKGQSGWRRCDVTYTPLSLEGFGEVCNGRAAESGRFT